MPFDPRVIVSESCTPVGNTSAPVPLCGGRREALLVSESHYRKPDGSWSGGGPFYCVKHSLSHGPGRTTTFLRLGANQTYHSKGCSLGPAKLKATVAPTWVQERGVLNGLYAKGYGKARPGRPLANVGQFLVELRDLPSVPFGGVLKAATRQVPLSRVPKVLLGQLQDYRNLGSEYLNVVFGWKPFVADVRKMYNLWAKVDKQLAQIVRENGKWVRRKATVSDDRTVTQTSWAFDYAYYDVYGAPPNWWGGTGRSVVSVVKRTREKVWFAGSFRYYIPDMTSSQWDRRARAALFGALPTPDVLYEVLPWSWLVDWFSNVGDVVANVSPNAVDNLAMRYSFIMRHVTATTDWSSHSYHPARDTGGDPRFRSKWPAVDAVFTTSETLETKSRVGGGNPFGLNVQLASLSSGQLAILAALGISRGNVL